jgi:hypothetical protein
MDDRFVQQQAWDKVLKIMNNYIKTIQGKLDTELENERKSGHPNGIVIPCLEEQEKIFTKFAKHAEARLEELSRM